MRGDNHRRACHKVMVITAQKSKQSYLAYSQARSQDRIWGCGTPQKWTFLTQKVDLLNLIPLNPPTKPHFWPTLWPKWTFCQIWGGGGHPLATGCLRLASFHAKSHVKPVTFSASIPEEITSLIKNLIE